MEAAEAAEEKRCRGEEQRVRSLWARLEPRGEHDAGVARSTERLEVRGLILQDPVRPHQDGGAHAREAGSRRRGSEWGGWRALDLCFDSFPWAAGWREEQREVWSVGDRSREVEPIKISTCWK